jgi:hypothetical protein
MFNSFVKSPKIVLPACPVDVGGDLIPAEDGMFDRHPELIENIRRRRTSAGMTKMSIYEFLRVYHV